MTASAMQGDREVCLAAGMDDYISKLAHVGSAEKVATALGNSEKTLRKHYMALVTRAEAGKFWTILPIGIM